VAVGGRWPCLTTMKAKHCPGRPTTPSPPAPRRTLCACVRACPNFFTFFRLLHFFHFLCAFNFAFSSLPHSQGNFLRPGRLLQLSDCLVAGQPQLFFGGAEPWPSGRHSAAVTGHRSGQINAIVRVHVLLPSPLRALSGPSINPEPLRLQPGNAPPPTAHHPSKITTHPLTEKASHFCLLFTFGGTLLFLAISSRPKIKSKSCATTPFLAIDFGWSASGWCGWIGSGWFGWRWVALVSWCLSRHLLPQCSPGELIRSPLRCSFASKFLIGIAVGGAQGG